MSVPLSKPSLADLPLELLRQIFADSRHFTVIGVEDVRPHLWLPNQPTEPEKWDVEATAQLLALSHTCRSLRVFALSVLWAKVQVRAVAELGTLRGILRASPCIAPRIHSFCFEWRITDELDLFPEETGSMLDLAFVNRYDVWKAWAARLGAEYEVDNSNLLYFRLPRNGRSQLIWAPGGYATQEPALDEHGQSCFNPQMPRLWVEGPDGNGEDRYIKIQRQLSECIVEVVAQLKSLETLDWRTPILPLPLEALAALEKVTTLRTLNCVLSDERGRVDYLPLWKLASHLTDLCIGVSHWDPERIPDAEPSDAVEEQTEFALASYELPSEVPVSRDAKTAMHLSIVYRTLVAAARGGQLRRLRLGLDNNHLQVPFAVPSLLPFWVSIDKWNLHWRPAEQWEAAAVSLRPLLAHASLALSAASSSTTERRLTREQVQSLHIYFVEQGWPKIAQIGLYSITHAQPISALPHVERYLQWLEADAELAQRVADAWNSVVEHGDADAILPMQPGQSTWGRAEVGLGYSP